MLIRIQTETQLRIFRKFRFHYEVTFKSIKYPEDIFPWGLKAWMGKKDTALCSSYLGFGT